MVVLDAYYCKLDKNFVLETSESFYIRRSSYRNVEKVNHNSQGNKYAQSTPARSFYYSNEQDSVSSTESYSGGLSKNLNDFLD